MMNFRNWWFRLRSYWTCLASFTDRNDQHRIYFCTLPRHHKSEWHTDGQAQWTGGEGWRDFRKGAGW